MGKFYLFRAVDIKPHLETVRNSDKPVVGLEFSRSLAEGGNIDWRLNLTPLKDAGQKTQGVAIVLDDLTERKKLEAQRGLLQRMVSPAVLDQIDPNNLQMGGKKVFITVLFADVRGFTEMTDDSQAKAEKHVRASHLTPQQTEAFFNDQSKEILGTVNLYLGAIADVVNKHDGTLDKYIGD